MLDRGSLCRIWGQAFVAGVLPIKVTSPSQKADQLPVTWKLTSFNQFKVAQRMAQEATRLLKNYDIPVNIESVKEPANKAVGTGTGLW